MDTFAEEKRRGKRGKRTKTMSATHLKFGRRICTRCWNARKKKKKRREVAAYVRAVLHQRGEERWCPVGSSFSEGGRRDRRKTAAQFPNFRLDKRDSGHIWRDREEKGKKEKKREGEGAALGGGGGG